MNEETPIYRCIYSCPSCKSPMKHHLETCIGFYGNKSEGEHFFCNNCNIETFPDGFWRYGK